MGCEASNALEAPSYKQKLIKATIPPPRFPEMLRGLGGITHPSDELSKVEMT